MLYYNFWTVEKSSSHNESRTHLLHEKFTSIGSSSSSVCESERGSSHERCGDRSRNRPLCRDVLQRAKATPTAAKYVHSYVLIIITNIPCHVKMRVCVVCVCVCVCERERERAPRRRRRRLTIRECLYVCVCADPWEHVLWMCAGSVTASYAVKQEAELVKSIEEKVASAKADPGKKKKAYTGPNSRHCIVWNLMAVVRE